MTKSEAIIMIGSLFVIMAISIYAIEIRTVTGEQGFLIGIIDSFFLWYWVGTADAMQKR